MNTTALAVPARGVIADMADRYGMDPAAFERVLRATVIPADTSKEQFAAFLLVAKEYGLNPIIKQIYAFPSKSGGIQPIVSIDGWIAMTANHAQFDGMEFDDHIEEGKLTAITCRMYRKDRSRPVSVTEYMSECRRETDTWKRWPARMLRHRATIQCARYAFGFSGIVDPEEFDRGAEVIGKTSLTGQVRRKTEALPAAIEDPIEIDRGADFMANREGEPAVRASFTEQMRSKALRVPPDIDDQADDDNHVSTRDAKQFANLLLEADECDEADKLTRLAGVSRQWLNAAQTKTFATAVAKRHEMLAK